MDQEKTISQWIFTLPCVCDHIWMSRGKQWVLGRRGNVPTVTMDFTPQATQYRCLGNQNWAARPKKPPAGFSFTRMVEDVSQSAFTAGVQAPLTYVAGQGPRPPGMVFTMSCTLRLISCLESVLSVTLLNSGHSSKARTGQSTFSVILTWLC